MRITIGHSTQVLIVNLEDAYFLKEHLGTILKMGHSEIPIFPGLHSAK